MALSPPLFLLFFGLTRLASADSLVLVPGGVFNMGSPDGSRDERPVHPVTVDSFYMDRAEVSIWEYLECVRAGDCHMPSWWNRRFFEEDQDDRSGPEWLALPVTGVSWEDANDYCRWKGDRYRLPTEAEWEYAAHAGAVTAYFWGESMDSASWYAVTDRGLAPVRSRRPNAFGLFDMTGNAWEWCLDRYAKNYYRQSPSVNPAGPTDRDKYPYRSARGGGWNEFSWNLRTANRSFGEPFRQYEGIGFRVCRGLR